MSADKMDEGDFAMHLAFILAGTEVAEISGFKSVVGIDLGEVEIEFEDGSKYRLIVEVAEDEA